MKRSAPFSLSYAGKYFLPDRAKAIEKTEHHLNPLNVLYCADDLMAEDSIIVADGGDFVGCAAYIMRPRGPLCWLDPGSSRSDTKPSFFVPRAFLLKVLTFFNLNRGIWDFRGWWRLCSWGKAL